MKKNCSVLVGMLTILALFSGVALADCEDDCLLTFQTCLKLCRQTTKPDSKEAGECAFHCMKGRDGCLKRCTDKGKKSEIEGTLNPLQVLSFSVAKTYNGLCPKCNDNWTSTTKPTKCPNCGHEGIVINEKSENIGNEEILLTSQNCVCAGCNRPCGSGHESWCIYKPKAKPDIETQKAVILSSSEENITETFLLALGGKLCCVEGGKVIGRCHELTPYYNPFNGECYASRDDCKKSYGGYDICLKCTTSCK